MGHLIDFYTGRSRMLRDRIARAESHWHDGMPGRHAVLSMLAFGLEETGDYAAAEKTGRRAVELEPRDGWGWHAVTHVMEMQNRRADGVAWLAPEHCALERRQLLRDPQLVASGPVPPRARPGRRGAVAARPARPRARPRPWCST
jgi:hypothetical protein